MMRLMILVLVAAACGTVATNTHRDTLDSIPPAAASELRKQANTAPIRHVSRERERGVELYEASWLENGLEREAKVTASGQLVEREEEVPSAQVPSAVRAAAIVKLPNATSIKFIKLMSGNYEAEAIIDGRERDVMLAPDGREVADDDDDGDDDDDEGDHD